MPDNARRAYAAIVAVVFQAALITALPKTQIGQECMPFDFIGEVRSAIFGILTLLAVGRPKAAAVAAAGPEHEPTVQDDQVLTALPPGQRRPQPHRIEID